MTLRITSLEGLGPELRKRLRDALYARKRGAQEAPGAAIAEDPLPENGSRSKYGAVAVEACGIRFDSKLEARRYGELLMQERVGVISDLAVHVSFGLHTISSAGLRVRVGALEVDFVYWHGGRMVCEDTKSAATRRLPVYRLKRAMFEAEYGVQLVEVTKTGVRNHER